ncbi:thiamine pyrophosphate-binding protein [Luxibacter massiliensis]|uniref:thiamine pyrophosphate-binding protein n=1 Tax=Luxibacter massiliensis TaxID=2219695 RepID=UPI000F05E951|nr:thiamine pyrophosphate-binding protein [Luxibacter massiliensis]
MKKKLSDFIWEYIADLGVKHVFMFPGGGAMHLVDSIGHTENLAYITLLHEQACSFAAETYARISDNIGAALVTTGPGGTNAVTGCAAAWLESTPVIFISGQAKTADLKGTSGVRQKGNQEIGIVDIVASITKYAVTVLDPDEIKYHLDKALYLAKEGRPGPVWLDIPLDVQASMLETESLKSYRPNESTDNPKELEMQLAEVASMLKMAKRPVMIAGQGIERGKGRQIFKELVEYLNIPVLTSWIAVELLPFVHPCNMGKPGMVAARYSNYTMQNADFILAVGTRLDPAMIGYNPKDFAPKAKKVIIDIDPAELNKFEFDVDLKIQSDAALFIHKLLNMLKQDSVRLQAEEWMHICQEWKRKYPLLLPEYDQETEYVNPYIFVNALSEMAGETDVLIPGSSGAGIDVFWLCLKNKSKQRMLATGSLGSMGYGLPAAIGACLASGQRTICIEGDGSIQLNIQEFASIKGMNLPIKIFILDNSGYLSIMNMQRAHFEGRYVGSNTDSHLYLPDILKVAEGYGIPIFEIRNHKNIQSHIERVLNEDGPALCRVCMADDIVIQPKVVSRVSETGSMESGGLIDLWPFLPEEELKKNIL